MNSELFTESFHVTKKILHILENEKHVDSIIEIFESAFPGLNIFLINTDKNNPLRFIKNTEKVVVEKYGTEGYRSYLNDMERYALVIFHSFMHRYKHDIILSAPEKAVLAGSIWGNELYSFSFLRKRVYLPRTRRMMNLERVRFYPKYFLKRLLFRSLIMAREKKKIRAFKQLDIICGIVPEEINLFKQISGSSAQGRIFYPANIEYLIGCIGVDAEKLTFRGNNILLGNSANFSNNHLDLLSVLSGIKHKIPEGCKIYCPLGYGSSFVRSTVARKGSRLFKQQFTPVNEFIPLEEYRDLIATCSAMLMYHHKQAALGTVLIGLWFGIKVYLSKVNPVFQYLMENGVTVFSIEHDLKDFDMEAPLTKARVDHTRENLMRLFGREAALTNTKLLVQMAYSRHIQT